MQRAKYQQVNVSTERISAVCCLCMLFSQPFARLTGDIICKLAHRTDASCPCRTQVSPNRGSDEGDSYTGSTWAVNQYGGRVHDEGNCNQAAFRCYIITKHRLLSLDRFFARWRKSGRFFEFRRLSTVFVRNGVYVIFTPWFGVSWNVNVGPRHWPTTCRMDGRHWLPAACTIARSALVKARTCDFHRSYQIVLAVRANCANSWCIRGRNTERQPTRQNNKN